MEHERNRVTPAGGDLAAARAPQSGDLRRSRDPHRSKDHDASLPAVVSEQECHQLATLARLSLNDDQAERFSTQLGTILGYIEQLRAVNTEGTPEYLPPSRPGSALRDDTAQPGLSHDSALAGAPEVRDHHVAVPKFKED